MDRRRTTQVEFIVINAGAGRCLLLRNTKIEFLIYLFSHEIQMSQQHLRENRGSEWIFSGKSGRWWVCTHDIRRAVACPTAGCCISCYNLYSIFCHINRILFKVTFYQRIFYTHSSVTASFLAFRFVYFITLIPSFYRLRIAYLSLSLPVPLGF